jgi:lipopolysaccharide biosynthesis regulator YciM
MNAWWDTARELTSPFTVGLVVLFAVGAIVWVSARRRWAQSVRPSAHHFPPTSRPFERGFDLLLDNCWQGAMEVLQEAVRTDPDRVLEYLELGKLCRRRDDPRRAARLFEHILTRPELQRDERVMALYELGLAYGTMGLQEHAVVMLERVLQSAPSHSEARRALRCLYEEMGCWEKAVAVERMRLKRGESTDARTLAALRTQQGKAAWAAGTLRDSLAHLRAALALDPDSTEATLLLGRLLVRQGKARRSLRVWDGLMQRRPEFLYLAFRDMQEAFRQRHNEAAWEDFLRRFTERHPDDPTGQLALAEWYAGSGRPSDAVACLQRALDLDPLCREAHLALLALYREQGMPGEVIAPYERLAHGSTEFSCGRFCCQVCGHTGKEPFWKCPSCSTWATPQRLLPQSTSAALGRDDPPPSGGHPDAVAQIVAVRRRSRRPRQERRV